MATLFRVQQVMTGVAGSPYYFTGYFDALGGTAQQAADAWTTFVRLGPSGMPVGSTHQAVTEVELIESTTGDRVGTETVNVASMSGSNNLEFLPKSNQALVRWRTNTFSEGREIRGRTNIGPIPQAESSDGRPVSTFVVAQNTRAAALVDDPSSTHVVYGRPRELPTPRGGIFAITQSGSTWDEWAVLRSRRD